MMGILLDISLWRRARPIERESIIAGPDDTETRVWDVGTGEVGIIQKKKEGKFLHFEIVADKPFGRVVGGIKRRITLANSRRGKQ